MNTSGQRICLNMIVKNEVAVIGRCLASVMPLIDAWVIVDTGSTDGTQQIIRETLAHLPGELYERPWLNFAHNRTEALDLARDRGEYVLVIDADEILEIEPGFSLPALTHDSYHTLVRYGGTSYLRRQLLRIALPWRYEGIIHEYALCERALTEEFLPGFCTLPFRDGARARDPLTYRKDAALLEEALRADPSNQRYAFYLAQSYRDCGEFESAIAAYRRRIDLGGWRDEVFYSFYQIAQLKERLQHPWPEVEKAYLATWEFHPHRAEPLYCIGMHYQANAEYNLSQTFLARALEVPDPTPDALFVEPALHTFQIAVDYAVASYFVGDQAQAIAVNNRLLSSGKLPPFAIDQVIRNRRFSLDLYALHRRGEEVPEPTLRVYVQATANPAPCFDDCLHSLLHQDGDPFEVVVLAPQIDADLTWRTLLNENFSLVGSTAATRWRSVQQHLEQSTQPPEAVLYLPPNYRFQSHDSLQTLRTLFRDANCHLAYAQYRTASGNLGLAEPPAGEEVPVEDITHGAPVLLRSTLLQSLAGDNGDTQNTLDTPQLLRAAGCAHIRFSDSVCFVSQPDETRPTTPTPSATLPKLPLISCMMVTLDRLSLAKQSIYDFARQTYPERELIIVTDGALPFRAALERYVHALGLDNVRFVYPKGSGRTLGNLRNIAMEAAQGDILCQWDDDDGNHPDRLMTQAQDLLHHHAGASFFTDHLQVLEDQRALCWIDWTMGAFTATAPEHLVPGTLMMLRNEKFRYPETGQFSRQGEDSALLYELHRNVDVRALSGHGYLYLYRFHGRNTFSRDHHYNLSNFRFSNQTLGENKDKLLAAARFYALPQPCCVFGKEGPFLVLGPAEEALAQGA